MYGSHPSGGTQELTEQKKICICICIYKTIHIHFPYYFWYPKMWALLGENVASCSMGEMLQGVFILVIMRF